MPDTQCVYTRPHSAVGSVSDCRSKGLEFHSGSVPYFHGDLSRNNFCGHSPSADSRRVVFSYKRKYVHEVLVSRLVKSVVR